ncbi:MAG: DUF2220 family protein [Bacteroidales bacterium]|jgi:hypothetical protein|nr:DUF2220 family protein [Bacteroidales bacterium]
MITADEIKKKAENIYIEYLKSVVTKEPFFPKVVRSNKSASSDFNKMRKELAEVIEHSKDRKNYGYTIIYKQINTRNHGIQSLPEEISFQSEIDFLKYLLKEKEVEKFKEDCASILSQFPELRDWIIKYPLKVIDNYSEWDSLLKVCKYFKSNPNPNLYIRELPVQVHTKFIEKNKTIIRELLDIIVEKYVQQSEKDFEKRFNLKYAEPTVRFRILDKNVSQQYFSGIDDLSIPVSQFEHLKLPVKRAFVIENKMNVLTFPAMSETIVLFGMGYGVEILKNVRWLSRVELFYWGDFDADGFQILSQFRGYFPHTRSILMDKSTFYKFFEKESSRSPAKVTTILNLTNEEQELYELLKANNWRLEQEKIQIDYVRKKCENTACFITIP